MPDKSQGNASNNPEETGNVHQICQEFQQQVRNGNNPDLRSCLNRCHKNDRHQAAIWLIGIEVRSLIARGKQPRCDEYLARYPEFADIVKRLIDSLDHSPDARSVNTSSIGGETTLIQKPDIETDSTHFQADPRFLKTDIGNAAQQDSYDSDGDLFQMKQFANYDIIRSLGRGGMGIVLLAEDRLLRRKVALKIMRAELSAVPEFKQRFFREARAMASVDSPHVMPLFQFGEDNGMLYICMPYVPGETLADRLMRSPRMKPSKVIDLLMQLAEGLEAAHRVGLIHRDIKPSNVWLASDSGNMDEDSFSRALLIDFGLVRVDNNSVVLTGSKDLLGTPGYLAPEQAQRGRVDARSDLFSLGIIAYQALTGYNPFLRDSAALTIQAIMNGNPRPVRLAQESTPPAVSDLVMTLLSKKPDDRPASATDLLRRLRGVKIRLQEETPGPGLLQHSHHKANSAGYSEGGWEIDFGTISEHSLHIFIGAFVVMLTFGYFWFSQYRNAPRPEVYAPPPTPSHVAAPGNEIPPPLEASDSKTANVSGEGETTSNSDAAVNPNSDSVPGDPAAAELAKSVIGRLAHHLSNGASIAAIDNSVTLKNTFQDQWTPIEGTIIDAQPADECRLIVLKIEHDPALTIYDAAQGKLVRKLLLPSSDFVFAAGGDTVVVYFAEFHELQRWNLKTYERELMKETPNQITNLAMHPDNARQAIVRSLSQDKDPRVMLSFLDTETLEAAHHNGEPIKIEPLRSYSDDTVHYRMNEDFSMLTEWSMRYSPSGLNVYIRLEDGSFRGISEHASTGFLIPTEQGFVFTQSGCILSSEAIRFRNTSKQIESPLFRDTMLYPALDGEYFVTRKPKEELALYHRGSSEAVCSLGPFPSDDNDPVYPAESWWIKSTLSPARRILPVLESDFVVLLPGENNGIIRRPLHLDSILSREGKPFLLVLSATSVKLSGGASLEYRIRSISDSVPVTFELVEGPQGLTVDSEGRVVWQAPTGIVGRVPVSVQVANPSGQRILHRFVIRLGGSYE